MHTPGLDNIKNKYGIVGRDERLYRALDTAVQVARTDLSVLIQGESGVGKEVIPRIIHDYSPRKTKRYIAINCGSIPEGTIDSELFGHEKGSFTGAIGEHDGYFAAADGGTLFLDEVGELPLSTQARLLRVLETGEYIRVGSNEPRKTNVRIVAATNVNMQRAIREGKFREDLYFRLCTISVKMPPLRDRGNDVLLLFKKFCYDTAERYQIPQPLRLSPEAEDVMRTYKWPGNIRQLRNLAEQMSILCSDQRIITPEILAGFDIYPGSDGTDMAPLSGDSANDMYTYSQEREMIFSILGRLTNEVRDLKNTVGQILSKGQIGEVSDAFHPAMVPLPEPLPDVQKAEPAPSYIHTIEEEEDDDAVVIEEKTDLNLEKMERKYIEEALRRNHYHRRSAAQDLGISERTLYRKIKDFGIEEI